MVNLDTRHTALIIVDLQQDFFDYDIWPDSLIPKTRATLVKNTNELVGHCRNRQIPIIWFKQAFKSDLSDAFLHMRRSGKKYTISGTDGCELLTELDVFPNDHILLKSRFSAFFHTDLEQLLERLNAIYLILAGITTAWCIRSTAVDAYQRDYEIVIAKECIRAFTEREHRDSVRAMDGYVATFLSNSEISECISTQSG
ncbi:MAG: cysteine hydrolase [Verrucomicrobia bacterium]|nr:cysteine hydrolase [Verrucomicrobiota bacterium]